MYLPSLAKLHRLPPIGVCRVFSGSDCCFLALVRGRSSSSFLRRSLASPAIPTQIQLVLAFSRSSHFGRVCFSLLLALCARDVSDVLVRRDDFAAPPTSNQSLEPTADRRENLLSMTSILIPEAQFAVVSGRSACSR